LSSHRVGDLKESISLIDSEDHRTSFLCSSAPEFLEPGKIFPGVLAVVRLVVSSRLQELRLLVWRKSEMNAPTCHTHLLAEAEGPLCRRRSLRHRVAGDPILCEVAMRQREMNAEESRR